MFLQKNEKFEPQAIVLIKSRPAAFKIRQGRKDGALSLEFVQVLFPIMGKILPAAGGLVTFVSLSDSIWRDLSPLCFKADVQQSQHHCREVQP